MNDVSTSEVLLVETCFQFYFCHFRSTDGPPAGNEKEREYDGPPGMQPEGDIEVNIYILFFNFFTWCNTEL